MNRRTFITTAGSIATLSLASSAAAQDGGNETSGTTEQPEEPEIMADLGNGITLRGIDREPNKIVLLLNAEVSQTLLSWQDNMAAMLQADQRATDNGVAAVNMSGFESQIYVDRGDQRLTLNVQEWRNAASVTVSTNEKTFVLSTQLPDVSIFDGQATWGLAGIGGFGAFGGTAWGTKRYRESKIEEQEKRQVEEVK